MAGRLQSSYLSMNRLNRLLNFCHITHRGHVTFDDYRYVPTTNYSGPMSTIETEEMDGQVMEMLEKLDLSQYQWFYLGLSYDEIPLINNDNLQLFINRVRYRNGVTTRESKKKIPKASKKKIIASSLFLKNRSFKLKEFIQADHTYIGLTEFLGYINFMKEVLIYPIPNRNCSDNFELQDDILLFMTKLLDIMLNKLYEMRMIKIESQVGQTICGFLNCSGLIIQNQMFTQIHVETMFDLAKKLTDRVKEIPRDFIFG